MEKILNLVWEYRFILILLLNIVLYAVFQWEKFKRISYSIMLQAKSLAKAKVLNTGQAQEDWVCKKLYQFLPKKFTVFISEQTLQKIVHYLYHQAKDYLDDGKLNNSIE